jgi:hypothetical protein
LALVGITLALLFVLYTATRSANSRANHEEEELDGGPVGRKQAERAVGELLQRHGVEVGLRTDLGDITWRVHHTGEVRAQRYFDQGLRLLVAFDMVRAHQSFAQAARLDPRCAMCAWGEALAFGQTLNAEQEPALEGRAYLDALHGLAVARSSAASSLTL